MKDLIRINKYISDTGFCSRREADKLIADERVTVNGILAEMGTKVALSDKVKIDGQIIHLPAKVNRNNEDLSPTKKKNKVNRSQRETVDYRSKNFHRGTRGGIRNIKRRKVEENNIPEDSFSAGNKQTGNKDFKKGIEKNKKGARE